MKKYKVAVIGATGLVGEALLEILEEQGFPVAKLFPVASERSAGEALRFQGKSVLVSDVVNFDFNQVDLAFFTAGREVSAMYVPKALACGVKVIDNTSEFRYQDDVPLVIPEVNGHLLNEIPAGAALVANPNCSTIQMLVALKPIYDAVGIEAIHVATYQAVSGAGRAGVNELVGQTAALLNAQPVEKKVFAKQIAFNVIPQIDSLEENGFTREEMKMVLETRKILNDQDILVSPTAVRVPVFFGHSEAIHIETSRSFSAAEAKEVLKTAPGVQLVSDNAEFPTAVSEGANEDAVWVGRVRNDVGNNSGLNLWVVADNVRKGGALNAVQIARMWLDVKRENVQ